MMPRIRAVTIAAIILVRRRLWLRTARAKNSFGVLLAWSRVMTLPSHVHSKFIREPIATLRVFLGARQRRIPWVWHVIAPSFRPGPFGSGPPGCGEHAAPGDRAGPPAGILRRTRAHQGRGLA